MRPSSTLERLTDVFFVDSQYGWATGTTGTIIHTQDAGFSWQTQQTGIFDILDGVYFVDRSAGWAVGDNGTILATRDGGRTWIHQTSRTANFIHGVSFADSWHGLVAGDYGTILRTDDGGGIETCRVQFVNGSVSPEYDPGDIYVGGTLLVDDLAFREATAFITLPIEIELTYTEGANSTPGASDSRFQLQHQAGQDYIVVFAGERAHPDRPLTIIDLSASVTPKRSENTRFAFINAIQDTPPLDYDLDFSPIADALSFGEYGTGEAATGDHLVHVRRDADDSLVESFRVNLGDNANALTPLVAVGFLEPPPGVTDRNSSLIAVDSQGEVTTPVVVTSDESATATTTFSVRSVYPNPSAHVVRFYSIFRNCRWLVSRCMTCSAAWSTDSRCGCFRRAPTGKSRWIRPVWRLACTPTALRPVRSVATK
jgi:hypothetical protein